MLSRATVLSAIKVALLTQMILGIGVETAPTERDPPPSFTHSAAALEKSSALNLSPYLKRLLLSTKATVEDRSSKTTARTVTAGVRAGRLRVNSEVAAPDKYAQMQKMISALEELHRMFNSTLSSRLTIMHRANGRNSGRKNKALPPAEGGVRATTTPPTTVTSTASRASSDAIVPSLTGRSFRKSLPPQTKKTNKRVCFWKYCSQN